MTNNLSDKRVLIAGSNGFIGRHVSSYLSGKCKILGIGIDDYLEEGYCRVDLTDSGQVNDYVSKLPEIITLIFLTGLAHSKGEKKDYQEFYKVNVSSLKNLLSSLAETGKLPEKIIFSSTISIYGENWTRDLYTEDAPKDPKTPYAKTKLEAENYLNDNYKDKSWILRFAPVYAENFKLNINRRTKIKDRFYQVGNGEFRLSLLNIENILKVIEGIIGNNIPSGTYNISDKKIYKYLDLLEWQKVVRPLRIPRSFMYIVYKLGQLTNKNFFIENSIKLSTDNIFTSEKISQFIELEKELENIK